MPRVRVMKARASRAVSCGHWVIRGEMIVLVPGGGWVCLACRLAEVAEVAGDGGGRGGGQAGAG